MASHGSRHVAAAPAPAPPMASRKRKEREGSAKYATAGGKPMSGSAAAGNRLLAGYLAHEFLTKGTLLGRKWDPSTRSGSGLGSAKDPNLVRGGEPGKKTNSDRVEGSPKEPKAYADVAYLLRMDGVHLPGIVNPTELARWLQL